MSIEITAIVSARNSERFIEGCIDNLLQQTARDRLEIIIIGCAPRKSEEALISGYLKREVNIRYFRTAANEPLYVSWNRAIKMARGRYLVTANVDDRSRPDAFEAMAGALDDNPAAALVYSDVYITRRPNDSIDISGKKKRSWQAYRVPDYSHKALLLLAFCGPRPMWRRRVHDRLGFFDVRYRIAGDYEFWLRIAERHPLLRIPEFLCLYYVDKGCLSFRYNRTFRREQKDIRKRYFAVRERGPHVVQA